MNSTAAAGLASPYDEPATIKTPRLLSELNALVQWHGGRCEPYRRILDTLYGGQRQFASIGALPYLPVRLFKSCELRSAPASEIVKTLTSSGTTGQRPSRIYLDKLTALAQSQSLTAIMRSYLGPRRRPLLIIDSPRVVKDRNMFSARGAGVLGFSQFGRDTTYALDDDMQFAADVVTAFIKRHQGEPIFLFGFTFMVWQYFYRVCADRGIHLDMGEGSMLLHGGGWKKLESERVGTQEFYTAMRDQFGIRAVHNYYGMVEQPGAIHMECERGYFHASTYSDVIARDPVTFAPLPFGAPGLLEVISTVPRSYPGHVVLTEDLGTVAGEDSCSCGRLGKFFLVHGRLPSAELRGCSDTHEFRISA